MQKVVLNGKWKMRKIQGGEWIDAQVPGSVYYDLLNAGLIEDPFYRDNEDKTIEAAYYDYEYEREFFITSDILEQDRIFLCCEGLDTISCIYINDKEIARTCNMHRTYEFDIKQALNEGKNSIKIIFYSPVKYIEEKDRQNPIWSTNIAMKGFSHLRKAHYMFGWDWGPKVPDMGIWRDIYIKAFSIARIDDVYITQNHKDKKVSLNIRARIQNWSNQELELEVSVLSPQGELIKSSINTSQYENNVHIDIHNPKLWWPNGYGEQHLYKVEVVVQKEGKIIDNVSYKIGLRTLTVRREKDQWGESFEFNVNGVSIFAMGADYIPEDNILARCTPEKTEKLINDCIDANFNCVRVWGGGIYPWDYFYDLCDRYGLVVWQDFLYACATYDLNDEFKENIIKETEDNVRRLRHHASLGLWCGNNEMEWAWVEWGLPNNPKLKTDYIKMFEVYIPEVVKEHDPNTFYWPASPSSGGGFDNPNDENRGDVHYWDVWHGLKPFTDYRKFYFRFCSEFGFQSFPCLKTVESFTLPKDRNIFSYVMEKHQKNGTANGRIMFYLSDYFLYPKDFDSLLYTSQLLQAEAIKYGVEHWRRNRGRCMGAIYWQLNDCWPVASWASIDSFGRWKALHYFAKRFFAPVLLSACETDTSVALHLSNETLKTVKGTIKWALRDNFSNIITEGSKEAEVPALSSVLCETLEFDNILSDDKIKRKTYLEYSFVCDGVDASRGTVLFCRPKHFEFIDPEIKIDVCDENDKFVVTVSPQAYAKYVELDLRDSDCRFSDNYFDLSKGENRQIYVMKETLSRKLSKNEFESSLTVRSIFDII